MEKGKVFPFPEDRKWERTNCDQRSALLFSIFSFFFVRNNPGKRVMCSPEKIPVGGVAIGKKGGVDSEGKSRNVSSPILSLSPPQPS